MNDNIKKNNKGVLFPNTNKTKPSQPDFTGKIVINDQEKRLSAWENKTPEGQKYLSIIMSDWLANQNNNQPNNNVQKNNIQKETNNKENKLTQSDMDDLDDILKMTDNNPFE